MKIQFFAVGLLFLFLCSFQLPKLPSNTLSEWKLEKTKDNIQVFTRPSANSNLKDSKVLSIVDGTPEEVLDLLLQFDAYEDWIPKCKESRLLKKVSETDYYYYARYAAPWPVSDRDVVIHFTVTKEASGRIVCQLIGEANYIEEVSGVVRVPHSNGRWFLTPQKDGKVEIINQYGSSPGGNIPDWLANTTAVSTPFDTMRNLVRKLK